MDGTYLLPVLYLGIVPGIVGHQVRDTSSIISMYLIDVRAQ